MSHETNPKIEQVVMGRMPSLLYAAQIDLEVIGRKDAAAAIEQTRLDLLDEMSARGTSGKYGWGRVWLYVGWDRAMRDYHDELQRKVGHRIDPSRMILARQAHALRGRPWAQYDEIVMVRQGDLANFRKNLRIDEDALDWVKMIAAASKVPVREEID